MVHGHATDRTVANIQSLEMQHLASGSIRFKVSCPIGRDPRGVMVAGCLVVCVVADIIACCKLEVETGPIFIAVGSPGPKNWISEPIL